MRGTDCAMYHQVVRFRVSLVVQRSHLRTGVELLSRLDTRNVKSREFRKKLEMEMDCALEKC